MNHGSAQPVFDVASALSVASIPARFLRNRIHGNSAAPSARPLLPKTSEFGREQGVASRPMRTQEFCLKA